MQKILVVAEKPSAGADMAKVLGCSQRKAGYIEGDQYIVTWAIGHLVGLKLPEEHDECLKEWKLENLPFRFPIQSSLKILSATEKQFNVIKQLIQRSDVDFIINAGDAGREGYLIQEWIYRLAGNKKPVKVLWASSLTEEALRRAFSNLHERSEFTNLLQEAEARAETDYLMGMNYSRGLTLIKGNGSVVLRYGRCQTPLLRLIVKRDNEIATFNSTPYFEVHIHYQEGFSGILVDENKKVKTFATAEMANDYIKNNDLKQLRVTRYTEELKKVSAPSLYNLADLQKEMGSKYGYDASKTLQMAQSLYEKHKILSYPRTDSRVMSTDLAREIGRHLESVLPVFSDDGKALIAQKWGVLTKDSIDKTIRDKKYVNDLKVTDHHALVPTINPNMLEIFRNQLSPDERNVFLEVAKRFLAIFLSNYTYRAICLLAVSDKQNVYLTKGKEVLESGWKVLYADDKKPVADESEEEENEISSSICEETVLHADRYFRKDKKTQAPSRYSVSSIISLMEKYRIGTSATRASIIERLMYSKSPYIVLKKGKYYGTELGHNYIALVPEELKSENLTADFEEQLAAIGDGKLSKDQMLNNVFKRIANNLQALKDSKEKLDTDVLKNSCNKSSLYCPQCGKIIYRGKYSWYCSGYKEGCKVKLPFKVANKTLSEVQVKQLLEKGKTGVLKGFQKKSGGTFSAKLTLLNDGKVKFLFRD